MKLLAKAALFVLFCFMHMQSWSQRASALSATYRPAFSSGTVGLYLKHIKQQTGIFFSYSSKYVDDKKIIAVRDSVTTVEQVLSLALAGQDLVIREQGNKILILSKENLADQESYTVFLHGYVKESYSKEALIGATIYIPALQSGTVTNNFGYFCLSIPRGKYDVLFFSLGFMPDTLSIDARASTRTDVLLEFSNNLDAVQVVSRKDQAPIHDHIVYADIKKRPVLLGENDVMRALQSVPGVQTGSGAGNLVLVRGGDPGQNLHLLDGVPLYYVDHFYGLTSVYNSDAIKSIDFYKGTFPARYGGRVSSVIDVSTKDGNMQKWGGQFSMGLVKSSLNIEGPLKKDKASIIFSARRTWIDGLWRPFTNGLSFNFYDVNIKSNYIINKNNRIFASIYNGRDRLGVLMSGQSSRTQWGSFAASSRWNSIINPHLFMNTMLTYSSYDYELTDNRQMLDNGSVITADGYKGTSRIRELAMRLQLNWHTGTKHNVEFGGRVSIAGFNPVNVTYSNALTVNASALPDKFRSNELLFFIEDQIKISDKFQLVPGVHFANWFSNKFDHSNVQPRLLLNYVPAGGHVLYASYSEMAQFLHLISNNSFGIPTDFWIPSSTFIEPEESAMSAVGYKYDKAGLFSFNLEFFNKKMTNVTTFDIGKNLFDNNLKWEDKIIQGSGRCYGAELAARRQIGVFNISSAYTWSWSWRQFPGINGGVEFPYRYDRRHNFKAALSFQPSARFGMTANWIYMSGEAITIPDQIYPDFDNSLLISNGPPSLVSSSNYTYTYSKWNSYRLPPVHRLDIGMNFTKEKKKGRSRTWSVGVFNVYARKNVMYVELVNTGSSANDHYVLKGVSFLQFVPFVSYQFKF